jgi:uncharacterized protein YabN with tetrapyrrole methylase and pyrophosphatase domain
MVVTASRSAPPRGVRLERHAVRWRRCARNSRRWRQKLARGEPADALIDEIGDLLFSVVNVAHKAGVRLDPASIGRIGSSGARFESVELLAAERGIELHSAGLEKLDELWDDGDPASAPRRREASVR